MNQDFDSKTGTGASKQDDMQPLMMQVLQQLNPNTIHEPKNPSAKDYAAFAVKRAKEQPYNKTVTVTLTITVTLTLTLILILILILILTLTLTLT